MLGLMLVKGVPGYYPGTETEVQLSLCDANHTPAVEFRKMMLFEVKASPPISYDILYE